MFGVAYLTGNIVTTLLHLIAVFVVSDISYDYF